MKLGLRPSDPRTRDGLKRGSPLPKLGTPGEVETSIGAREEIELYSSLPDQSQAARLIYKHTTREKRGKVVAWQRSTLGTNVKCSVKWRADNLKAKGDRKRTKVSWITLYTAKLFLHGDGLWRMGAIRGCMPREAVGACDEARRVE